MSTTINVIGTIATDPRLISHANGTALCSFRLASDERRYDRDKQAWVEGVTNWFGVACFRTLATHAHRSFRKGDRIIVSGKLKVRKWEKDGKQGTSVEIEAEAIGHDLRWGVSRFEKLLGAQSTPDSSPQTSDQSVDSSSTAPAPHAPDSHISEPQEPMSPDGFTPQQAAA